MSISIVPTYRDRRPGAGRVSAGPAFAQDKVRFQTDWIPSGEHAMYYGAWSKGIYAKHGIDITITRGYGSGDTVTKLAGGAADFGVADLAAVFTARARTNVPVKTIAVLYNESPHSLFVLKSSGITSFKGLEGKKIGITPGNSHRFYFPEVAKKAGTDPNKIDLDQHGWRRDGGPAHRQEHRRRAVLFDPLLLHQQGGGEGGRGDPAAAVRRGRLQDLRRLAHHHRQDDPGQARPGEALPGREQGGVRVGARPIPRRPASCTSRASPRSSSTTAWAACKAVMAFVFNDHSKEFGWGKESPERLKFSWDTIAEANELKKDYDYKQAIDTESPLPK